MIVDRVMIAWLYYFYVSTRSDEGAALMAPLVFSGLMLAGRVVDALADPVIARWSDNHGGARGRRIPFMAVSTLPYVLVFVALFSPPVAGRSPWNAVWLAVLLAAYFVAFTAYVAPYLALLADLSRTTKDRVDLSTSKAIFTLVGAGVALIGSGLLIDAFGFRGMVWSTALLGLALLCVPLGIRERRYAAGAPATLPLVEAVRTTLSNRPFVITLVTSNAFWFGFNIITLNIALYVTSLMAMEEAAVALFMGAAFGVALVAFAPVNAAAKRYGLKAVMIGSLGLFAAVFSLIYLFGEPVLGLAPLTFALLAMGAGGVALAGFFIVPDAVIATVADLEEGEGLSGQRREAMYFGVHGLTLKVNLGISTLVSGALLQFIGDPLGIQLTGPVAAVAAAIGAAVFLLYPERQVNAQRQAIADAAGQSS